MSATQKFIGLLTGFAVVAGIGTAVAQSVPPNPLISNPPIAAGQQSTHHTAMGETGVMAESPAIQTAVIIQEPAPVAAVEQPAPIVAEAPAPVEARTMGAAPAPVAQEEPAPVLVARADRN